MGFAFSPAFDELFSRGYPHLRVLTDEDVDPEVARREASEATDAIDPYLPVFVPRAVATRFINAYTHGPSYRLKGAAAAKREAALDDTSPVDEKRMTAILDWLCPVGMETYQFRVHEVIFLLEAFLGTQLVAEALVETFVGAARSKQGWGIWGTPTRTNATAHYMATALGYLRLRLEDERWTELVAPLRDTSCSDLAGFIDILHCLADDDRETEHPAAFGRDLALQRHDAKALRPLVDPRYIGGFSARVCYVLGADALADAEIAQLRRMPKWQQRRFIEEHGQIAAPGTVRAILGLVTSRSAAAQALRWFDEHADYARNVLSSVDTAGLDRQLELLREHLGPGEVTLAGEPTEQDLEAELADLFTRLGPDLAAQGGDVEKEKAVLSAAYTHYCEARAAAGDVTPGAYFSHRMADYCAEWEADEQTLERWFDLVSQVW